MIGRIVNLLYPASCQICNAKLEKWNQGLCCDCFNKIKRRTPPFCIKCGKHLTSRPDKETTCSDCAKTLPYFDRALSVFYYKGVLRDIIHNFKYKNLRLPKKFIEETLDFMLKYGVANEPDIVISIPMHPSRLFKREINPSHILAKDIARKLKIRYSEGLLKKQINTPPQSKLSRSERIYNARDSFVLQKNKKYEVREKNILLVDDLFTTGRTVNECARILKEAGTSRVEIITLARGDSLP